MFKNYEMQKHFEREQKLQNMTEEDRKKFLSEEEANKKREHDAAKTVISNTVSFAVCRLSYLMRKCR